MRLVLTGFGAFPGVEDNPSQALVEHFRLHPDLLPSPRHLALLDVDYAAVGSALDVLLEAEPEALILTGYSNLAAAINLEAQASGLCAADKPDIRGFAPSEAAEPPETLTSNCDLPSLRSAVEALGLPCHVSQDAGAYLCNYSYRHVLARIAENQLQTRALFVHLPALEGSGLASTSAASISMEAACTGIVRIAQELTS